MQGNLFGPPTADWTPRSVPYAKGSATSEAAAEAIKPKAGSQRARVYAFILGRGEYGATDEEIQAALGISESSVRPRRGELREAGLIHDSGRTRPTRSGGQATVWVAS